MSIASHLALWFVSAVVITIAAVVCVLILAVFAAVTLVLEITICVLSIVLGVADRDPGAAMRPEVWYETAQHAAYDLVAKTIETAKSIVTRLTAR
jgi:hypothetical protein